MEGRRFPPWTKFNGWNRHELRMGVQRLIRHPRVVVELQRSEKSPTPTSAGNVWGEIAAATEGKYI